MSLSLETQIPKFLVDNRLSAQYLSRKEVWMLQEAWRKIYSKRVSEKTGKWIYKGKDWHSFSYSFTDSISGSRAELAYKNESPIEFILLISNRESVAYSCKGEVPPSVEDLNLLLQQSSEPVDFYVFPFDLSWTLVMTHEVGCGPYFAINHSY